MAVTHVEAFDQTTIIHALEQRLAEERDNSRRLAELAFVDPLTGVHNRNALDATALQVGEWVLLADLNGFKRINDTRGHAAGDDALQRFALFLTTVPGQVFRLGGDEFLVITHDPHATSETIARWRDEVYGVTASIGGAPYEGNLSAAIAHADRLMYQAKDRCRSNGDNDRRRNTTGGVR